MKFRCLLFAVLQLVSNAVFAQSEIVFAGITEANGIGALAGISFKNGYNLAIEEINASGGLTGKKIVVRQFDIDTHADAARQAAMTAVAEKPFVVLVIYTNEAEAVDVLKELKRQGFDRPIVGEGPLASQQVIDLAEGAANNVYAHTGISVDAPNARITAFAQKYKERYQSRPDHNSIKGYFAVHAIKAVADATYSLDRDAFVAALKKARFESHRQPNVLMRGSYDMFGNLYRESYLVRIRNGRQFIVATIPPSEGQTIDLVSGKEIYLNSNEGRKQFFAQAQSGTLTGATRAGVHAYCVAAKQLVADERVFQFACHALTLRMLRCQRGEGGEGAVDIGPTVQDQRATILRNMHFPQYPDQLP